MMRSFIPHDSIQSRREFLGRLSRATLGVTTLSAAGDAFAEPSVGTQARQIILIFASGGMSHLDTFDPKPEKEEQGPLGVIRTKTPGLVFGETFPGLAELSEHLAVIRSLTTQTGDHVQGQYLMRTSYPASNSTRHPSLGSWVVHTREKEQRTLPGFIGVQIANDHPGSGFLDPTVSPMPVPDPAGGILNMKLRDDVSVADLNLRLRLAHRFDRSFKRRYKDHQIDVYDAMFREAVSLMGSNDTKVFDLTQEPESVRESYGRGADGKLSAAGQGCLLARRLVEAGVPMVEIEVGGWDGHFEWFANLPKKGRELDVAMSVLLRELSARGLLESTLVVLTTEFGRTPAISGFGGREHHPGAFTSVLAGAGVKAGCVFGATDDVGFAVDRDPVSVADFNTTIAAAVGLPYGKEFFSPIGRPFKIGGGGTPIREILA